MADKWPTTRRAILARAEREGIEVEIQFDGLWHHVHAWSPKGKRFGGSDIHNLGLWDSTDPIAWAAVAAELDQQPLTACEPTCDVCFGVDEGEAP